MIRTKHKRDGNDCVAEGYHQNPNSTPWLEMSTGGCVV